MPIARSASAPVRARPLTVAARVGALWDEAVATLEGTGAGDGAAVGALDGSAEGSALGVGAGASPPSSVSPMSSGLWSEER